MYGNLAELGDKAAVTQLENTCSDHTTNGHLRVLAAQDLWNVHNRQCLPSVLWVAENGEEDTERQVAVVLLANYFWDGTDVAPEKVMATVCDRLADESSLVRIQAADTLARIGTREQAACLETALSTEQENTVRQQMEQALKTSRKRPVK
jgi:HEAT repeat protein